MIRCLYPSLFLFAALLLHHDCYAQKIIDGDFNDDGFYDCLDINELVGEIAVGANDPGFDLTGDGQVNLDDLAQWLNEAGQMNIGSPYLPGDANLDSVVAISDYLTWRTNALTATPEWCSADFNADGVVNGLDFVIWNNNKFCESGNPKTCGSTDGPLIAVPGDGIPDLYYLPESGLLTLHTDGIDLIALVITGPDFELGSCILCDGGTLPGFADQFSVALFDGFGDNPPPISDDVAFFIRTTPSTGDGPVGLFNIFQLPGGPMEFPLFAGLFDSNSSGAFRLHVTSTSLGDVNRDGAVNPLYIGPFINRLSSGTYQFEADCNQDGVVNLLDVDFFIAILAGG